LSLEFRNEGGDAWSSRAGYDFAYQVFDATTDNLITEGPRAGRAVAGELAGALSGGRPTWTRGPHALCG
jgi:hypothetical protein